MEAVSRPDPRRGLRVPASRLAWLPLALTLAIGAESAEAIVSDRHLRGVGALECDLEAGADAPAIGFRLLVYARERMLQLVGTPDRFGYQEVSESALRFPLVLAHGAPLACELELPAGALACVAAGAAGPPRLGLCLPSP
jgi:hypothetical protein